MNPFGPFESDPSWLQDRARRCPFGDPPPVVISGTAVLNDRVIWTLFLKRLGNSDQEDAETITAFAQRLGVDRSRIIAKLAAHYHDNQTLQ
jgi:hypothetical protein